VLLFIQGGGRRRLQDHRRRQRDGQHADEFRRQWQVVSFDPRGIERSSPIRCSPDCTTRHGADRSFAQRREFDALARANAAFIASCVATTEAVAQFLADRRSVATTTLCQN
jgi:hypothetical protein